MSYFTDLKKQDSQENLEKFNKEADAAVGGSGFQRDPRYWRPLLNEQGNGSAVIRFLPPPQGEKLPFVKRCSFSFKNPITGRWYIKDSPVSIGLRDPVAELNSRDWNTGTEEGKNKARSRRMRRFFTSNIYVVEHKARREDEGKVFLYNYGRTIFDMLKEKRSPNFADQEAYNPFSLWTGANFRLRVLKKDGFPNYDSCDFDPPGPLLPSDKELEKLFEAEYSLTAEVAPEKFDSYEQLKARLDEVLGGGEMYQTQHAVRSSSAIPEIEPAVATLNGQDDDDESGAKFFQELVRSRAS